MAWWQNLLTWRNETEVLSAKYERLRQDVAALLEERLRLEACIRDLSATALSPYQRLERD